MQHHYDIIIMGAGPAGSTAAILLARAGWSVALIEKQAFPRRKDAAVKQPITAPYGMRQMYLHDPDGYSLCFQCPAQA